jgi:hypothetical protein
MNFVAEQKSKTLFVQGLLDTAFQIARFEELETALGTCTTCAPYEIVKITNGTHTSVFDTLEGQLAARRFLYTGSAFPTPTPTQTPTLTRTPTLTPTLNTNNGNIPENNIQPGDVRYVVINPCLATFITDSEIVDFSGKTWCMFRKIACIEGTILVNPVLLAGSNFCNALAIAADNLNVLNTDTSVELFRDGYTRQGVVRYNIHLERKEIWFSTECSICEVTPTPTPTQTTTPAPTQTNTPTVTPTVTPTQTITPSVTPTNTPTVTITKTPRATPTNTPTSTPTPTVTVTQTSTITPTLTLTPTRTKTMPVTPTPSKTNSGTCIPSTGNWVIKAGEKIKICGTVNLAGAGRRIDIYGNVWIDGATLIATGGIFVYGTLYFDGGTVGGSGGLTVFGKMSSTDPTDPANYKCATFC